ncbi:hypothetical protein [Geothrix sp.]|jgi:hypothetical protein|uniref:hypothetical protein n=1 Tax=Geothrix sp. TaxID=1962974 RepID=UPI0025B85268|nr:hypothetical protein [Geothrix sp.]
MRTAGQIQDLSTRLVSTSSRLVSEVQARVDKIAAIKNAEGRTMDWITDELAKVGGFPAIQALHAQVEILQSDLKLEEEAWSNLGQVLRLAAMPDGATQERAAVLSLLREEAEALEADPSALQAALEDAAVGKDWERLYALSLGRLDANGSPLPAWTDKIRGIRFDALDLTGQESTMESFYRAKVAYLEADLAFSDAKGEARNYTNEMLLIRAAGDYERAKFDRRERLLRTPAAALAAAEAERTEPSARFQRIEAQPGSYGIFDTLTGSARFVGIEEGPAYLAQLNDPTQAR